MISAKKFQKSGISFNFCDFALRETNALHVCWVCRFENVCACPVLFATPCLGPTFETSQLTKRYLV